MAAPATFSSPGVDNPVTASSNSLTTTQSPTDLQNKNLQTNSPWKLNPTSADPQSTIVITSGVAKASIPANLYDSLPLWSNCIVGYFIDEPPHVAKIHAAINRLWRTKKQAESKDTLIAVEFLNPTTVLFRIPNKQTREFILDKHVWHIGKIPMVVQQWSPTMAKSSPDMTRIPVWVDLFGVSDALYSEKGLKFLGDIVGKYQSIHTNTEKCLDLEVARVLVMVNFEKELIRMITLEGNDGEISVKVSYPWVPLKCSLCNRWGHASDKCPESATNKQTEASVENVESEHSNTETMNPGHNTMPQVTVSHKPTLNSAEEKDKDDGWLTVKGRKSPRKISSPQNSEKIEQTQINPFNILQHEEHGEGEIETDKDADIETEHGENLADVTDISIANTVLPAAESTPDEISNQQVSLDEDQTKEQPMKAGTRGRGRGRGRGRKPTTTHSELNNTNQNQQAKASSGKHL